jgi:hypothetical protein
VRGIVGSGLARMPSEFACRHVIIEYLDWYVCEFDKGNALRPPGGAIAYPTLSPPFSLAVRSRRLMVRLGWSRFAQGVVSAG